MSRRALDGNNADDRKTISHAPYNYKNTLTMKGILSDIAINNRSSLSYFVQRKWR